MARERKNQERLLEIWLEGIRVCLVSIPKIKRQTTKHIRETHLGKKIRSCGFTLSLRCLLDIQVKIPSSKYASGSQEEVRN